MKLIAGLGNPGTRYIDTPHNIGFRVIDSLAKRYNVKTRRRFFGNAKEVHLVIYSERLMLIQPLTFMNLSGSCISKYIGRFKLTLDKVLVVCDDVNLPLGEIRIRPAGSAGGHNGLESIIKGLGSEDFPRLRIGIKTERACGDLAEYVLTDFKKDEAAKVEDAIERASDACDCWIRENIDKAMSLYNR